jgi:hypothetical protein
MTTTTVRLRAASHKALKEISEITGQSLQDALDRAIEDLRRKVYLEGLSADYAALRADPKAWQAHQQESSVWDATNADGLEDS